MLNADRLHYLHAVARHGSVAAASAVLHVTPSGISQQLGKLERETGHRLLEPQGRGLRLTHAGRVLAEHAEGVVAGLKRAEQALAELHDDIGGPVRIGAFSTATLAILPRAFAVLRQRHRALRPQVREGEADETLPALSSGELDLGVVESWDNVPTPLPAGLTHRVLARDVADLALPSDHPLASRQVVDLAEVDDLPWVSWNSGTACHQWLVQTLREQNLEPQIACRVSTCPSIVAFVAAGVCAALVPRLGREPLPNGVAMVPTRPSLHRTIVAAWRTDAERPAIRACVDALSSATTAALNGHAVEDPAPELA